MVFAGPHEPLERRVVPDPEPGPGQVLIRVKACGVCRTDLHIVDGELDAPQARSIPGHEIVGVVEALGAGVDQFAAGDRVGVPWLGWTCGIVRVLPVADARTSASAPASPATTSTAATPSSPSPIARYCFALPDGFGDVAAAPLLCAGLIGYRALRLAGDAHTARHLRLRRGGAHRHAGGRGPSGREVYAFTKPGDAQAQAIRTRPRRSLGRRHRVRPRP